MAEPQPPATVYRAKSHRCTSNHISVFIDNATDDRVRGGAMSPRDHAGVELVVIKQGSQTAPHQCPEGVIKKQRYAA
jgi:hypothetical protein